MCLFRSYLEEAYVSELSKEELRILLDAGDFGKLIGVVENDSFDCKNEIYHLEKVEKKRISG